MFSGFPDSSQIICNSRNTTGTLITVPAGFGYTGTLSMAASVSVLGNSAPTVTVSGTNSIPNTGTVIGRLHLNGLALTTVNGAVTTEVLVYAPPENDITIEFTAGAAGTSSATLSGFTFG